MSLSKLKQTIKNILFNNHEDKNNIMQIMPDLFLFKENYKREKYNGTYEVGLGLILQGAKEIYYADRQKVTIKAGQSFIISHSTPASSQIIKVNAQEPYLGLAFGFDMKILQELYLEIGNNDVDNSPTHSLLIGNTNDDLLDALTRYIALHQEPQKRAVLAPLIRKEIHFLALTSPQGAMLRQTLSHNSYAARIMRATSYISEHFNQHLHVPKIAQLAGMSESSFYKHFKLITGLSPLQYQKELRLIKAHDVLKQQEQGVAAVAFAVGYESPTQFSREFMRKFGLSPREV